jgi:hypothetical protein
MNNSNQFKLISGEFSYEQAKDILTDLYSSKIKFHSVCALRHEEKYAKKSTFHADRIMELKSERDQILKFLENRTADEKVKIESTISITIS